MNSVFFFSSSFKNLTEPKHLNSSVCYKIWLQYLWLVHFLVKPAFGKKSLYCSKTNKLSAVKHKYKATITTLSFINLCMCKSECLFPLQSSRRCCYKWPLIENRYFMLHKYLSSQSSVDGVTSHFLGATGMLLDYTFTTVQ